VPARILGCDLCGRGSGAARTPQPWIFLGFFHPGFSRACFVSAAPSVSNAGAFPRGEPIITFVKRPRWAARSHQSCASHDKAEIGGRNSIRRIGPSGGGS
jgi:hypothetical protein